MLKNAAYPDSDFGACLDIMFLYLADKSPFQTCKVLRTQLYVGCYFSLSLGTNYNG